jgi:general secretion pathway protein B
MSYILDALKKADRERNLGDVPDLESAHWVVRKASRTGQWPRLVAALLLFNAALLAYLFGRDAFESTASSTHVSDPPEPAAAGADGNSAGQTLTRLERPVRESPRETRPRVNYPVAPARPAQPERAVGQPAQATQVSPQVIEAPTPLSAGAGDSQWPEWSELPLELRSGFALPHIDVHVYAEEPARRFVLIDLKKYREGDALDSGAVLEKINPGSIQLLYQGTRFRVDR